MRHSRPVAAILTLSLLLLTALQTLPQTQTADHILIEKSAHTMKLLHHGEILKTYKVSLSRVPVGAKQRSGDHKVPEGQYIVDSKNHQSKFHLALHVSYPNATDRERAKKMGVDPGGNIEIHGLDTTYAWVGSLHRTIDWTNGCIAVTNPEIEEIFPMVPVGTPVEIRP
jgi:murein L,D-transpeptidase YafK